jgi:hypothetical protein
LAWLFADDVGMADDPTVSVRGFCRLQLQECAIDSILLISKKDGISFLKSAAQTCAGREVLGRGLYRYTSKLLQTVVSHSLAYSLSMFGVSEGV